ncbi:MAG TPA: nitronate monooxygenase [Armatimonadota bacterium]
MKQLNDFTLTLGKKEYVPIIIGGMGVDTSSPELALAVAKMNGISHLSDAMILPVVDRHFHTHFVQERMERYKSTVGKSVKPGVVFDHEALDQALKLYIGKTMEAKKGDGGIFVNVMEKLAMGNTRESMRVRLNSAMDAGVDGITLSAGLHLGSLDLMRDNPRFRDVKIGIIVSSARALKLFMRRAARLERLPDYIIVEGPLAGGHLGFPLNWQDFDLKLIIAEVLRLVEEEGAKIPVIAAGGIFTGSDGVEFLEMGAAGIQVATRFAVTKESGLPYDVKQQFFKANEEDVEVNLLSPTGYPMRMLKSTPAITAEVRTNCEAFGYGLDESGNCPCLIAHEKKQVEALKGNAIEEYTCLCTTMFGFKIWTCGQNVYRLKDTTNRLPDGSYQLPTAEHVFRDYQYSTDHQIALPELELPQECLATA